MSSIVAHYREVRAALDAAAREALRDPSEIELLAVSKTFPAEAVRELYDAGVRKFGESRIPELAEKAAALPDDIEWHLIGRLQSNKARKAVQLARVIHSVDSLPLLERLDRIAGEEGKHPRILLEVNVSGEASKAGVPLRELEPLARRAADCANLDFAGFMTMAPADAEPVKIAAIFELLTLTRDDLERKLGRKLPLLSMGMSGDFEIAARHGSTLVRVGTLIFGAR
ncbi:YggS family pyridoxal phosphate-dependent enzyme [uncultured Victivallis sp.]|uniref:YggS family pyridoxal phosphate-dependent enzyme n=1 Tax=uncultured Victivallis sp. TaxID=354118 RepID=UPI0025E713C4|nr:YggS family pyridoxal phosphate-dependent enzyme [uncultured Victivallis sp.]